ncbi:sensor histidine kinase [Streptomyces profundus]|uniref:sensor histidine kinase n=1 Tax=Streptomyces profundus TaxID=2867410 RepID=UPI001D160602|nr:histidine kinase [Streptomyces sp. MA3_2.13]UED87757.1 hypothetical protein K4G22_29115 [Streptomyces sp. MA3_2.13]
MPYRRNRPWAAPPPWGADLLWGVGVAAVVSLVISAEQGGRQQADATAYVWAVGLGALMLARRSHPRVVLAATSLGMCAYYAAGYPAIGLAVPLAGALFSATAVGRLGAALVTGVAMSAISLFFRLLEGQDPSFVVGYDLVGHVALMVAAIACGDSVHSRRAAQEQQARIAELTAQRQVEEAEHRAHADRLAIARDLHDSLGHSVAVISLHSDVALEALDRDRGAAVSALGTIRETTGGTLRELRRTVALLRAHGAPAPAPPSFSRVAVLTSGAEAAGLDVVLDIAVDGPLPAAVDEAAYRIAQEAVTNVVRHAATASMLTLTARITEAGLTLRVADDGGAAAGAAPAGHGHGIVGMSERARALGGWLRARAEPEGFVVFALLPLGLPR